MTALEKLGLEVAAFQLLGSRSKAATICALIEAHGVTLGAEAIANARVYMGDSQSVDPSNVAKARICLLRESLEDVGLGGLIVSHPGPRYALPEPGRSQIIARLVEVAT